MGADCLGSGRLTTIAGDGQILVGGGYCLLPEPEEYLNEQSEVKFACNPVHCNQDAGPE